MKNVKWLAVTIAIICLVFASGYLFGKRDADVRWEQRISEMKPDTAWLYRPIPADSVTFHKPMISKPVLKRDTVRIAEKDTTWNESEKFWLAMYQNFWHTYTLELPAAYMMQESLTVARTLCIDVAKIGRMEFNYKPMDGFMLDMVTFIPAKIDSIPVITNSILRPEESSFWNDASKYAIGILVGTAIGVTAISVLK